MLLLPQCLNNLAEFVRLRLHILFFAPYFLHLVLFYVMCLTPRNHFEFVDKLYQTQSYTTYNAEIDVCDFLDIDDNIPICNSDLAIVQLNIRGLYSKQHKLKELLMNTFRGKVPDVILLCETWQSKNSPDRVIEGYNIVQKYREHRKGGGVPY